MGEAETAGQNGGGEGKGEWHILHLGTRTCPLFSVQVTGHKVAGGAIEQRRGSADVAGAVDAVRTARVEGAARRGGEGVGHGARDGSQPLQVALADGGDAPEQSLRAGWPWCLVSSRPASF